jgi:hypothetical protein
MNPELIAELKNLYRNKFLTSPEGLKRLKMAVALKKEWEATKAKSNVQFVTASVDTTPFSDEFKSRLTKIEITPIGINNCCHQNTDFFCNEAPFDRKSGWNMTSCPCGRFYSFELHSVNEYNGVLYDFTKDFNEETSKYFIEIRKRVMPDTIVQIMGDKNMYFNKGCRCPINWEKQNKKVGFIKTTEEGFLSRIEFLENVRIFC